MTKTKFHDAGQRFGLCSGSNGEVGEALMPRCRRSPLWFAVSALLLIALSPWAKFQPEPVFAAPPPQMSGSLDILGKDGKAIGSCPLRHTQVRGAVSGFLARVTVTQVFENSAANPIEAVYTFPLPQNASVDEMTIQTGDRTIRSVIKKREEARAIYEKAKATGHVAAILDQERPNIFSQAVANILPGEQVTVTISYVDTLQYQDGAYEFVFPMVVGPRYIPGEPTGKQAGGWAPDTDKVPDASRITPNVAAQGTRAGHDISLEVAIDAGVPIQQLRSGSHKIDVERPSANSAKVNLRKEAEIPNKDFILKYSVAGQDIGDAVLSQWSTAKPTPGGYFTLILQPPARVPESDVTPKELVFVLDTSGSMMGYPIEKAKELISHALDELYPGDTFNLITFSGDTRILFPEPVFPTAENIRKAKELLNQQRGYGGTEMMNAIRAALEPSDSQDHLRVVCFLTDGYVGNDLGIIGEVQKHPNARVFAYGIGNSVNRFLIEGMAKAGRGDSEVVELNGKADEAAHRLYERLRSPLLTDISVDWRGLPVADEYPQRLPDLFDGKPLVITGRYITPASGTIRLRGKRAGEEFVREIPVVLTGNGNQHSVLPGFWARRRIDDLMSKDWGGAQSGNRKPEVQKEITQLGLDYRLMTQFTSFVAVEDRVVTKDGKPQRVEVPVEMPEGVSREGVFGEDGDVAFLVPSAGLTMYSKLAKAPAGQTQAWIAPPGGGTGSGAGRSIGGPVSSPRVAVPTILAAPAPPAPGKGAPPVDAPPKLSPERRALESKLQPALLQAFDCVANKRPDCKLVNDGNVKVQLWLLKDSPALREALQKAGFKSSLSHSMARTLAGEVPIDKLQLVAQIAEVQFISVVRK